MSQYLLLVLSAILLIPFSFPLVGLMIGLPNWWADQADKDNPYHDGARLERIWHEEAAKLGGAAPETIDSELRRLHTVYSKAGMFWVDGSGNTRLQLPEQQLLPRHWNADYTVQFMKEAANGTIFTIVAFIGTSRQEGFLVFQMDRERMISLRAGANHSDGAIVSAVMLLVLALYLLMSLLFFNRIRTRLVRLQSAMTSPAAGGIPNPVAVDRTDEIGQLELAFNSMIEQLEAGRLREAEEEQLRRNLIAKLSHDLRTPLTTIRGHAFSLVQENLSEKGVQSLRLIDRKVEYVGQLIDNLLSYTLLSSGKYPYEPKSIDVVRMARIQFAGWYPAFEQADFVIDLDLPESAVYWHVDPRWLERVLDNYLQNVLRHARSGRYIAFHIVTDGGGQIRIADRGPGMAGQSEDKGAGIGLSIASLMLEDMQLRSEVRSSEAGTIILIRPDDSI
ncbi:HAMP domain-containing sensor histidine kinase [Paenibacillus kobensis]|uniref:HAMP domain-containing sensor histidine kinase n=1 Tax=Paenibacillus kobensis TaxID=59841 RepID=UPI001FEB0A3E|nr:histidine kinase dimerization/phospho-acceptor domain-containing protein [Paenibacillus kobensis]